MILAPGGGRRAAVFGGRLSSDVARSLAHDLSATVQGEVRFDQDSRARYATDSSNYRQVPIGVVVPRSVEDVARTLEICRRHDTSLLPRGGGTSLAGKTCNVAVVVDFPKYLKRVLEIDAERRIARVQPGVILDDLCDAAERHHLTFGPDPATHSRNTLSGMFGNNSCGAHSVMACTTVDNVVELELLTYDGQRPRVGVTDEEELARIIGKGGRRGDLSQRMRDLRDRHAEAIRSGFPEITRRTSGCPLDQLLPESGFTVARALTGTEGTCVTVLEATVRLVDSPAHRAPVVLGYPDITSACGRVLELIQHDPIGLEGMDGYLVADIHKKHLHSEGVRSLPDGNGWLIIEFGADTFQDASDRARGLVDAVREQSPRPTARLVDDPQEQRRVWDFRESALAAAAESPGQPPAWPGWEDSGVPPARLGDYLRDLRVLMERYRYRGGLYGHFGQGCVHDRMSFDLRAPDGIRSFRAFMGEAADWSCAAEARSRASTATARRAELRPKMFGPELMRAFYDFKEIWNPSWKMNPGKMVDPNPLVSDLRLGTGYEPAPAKTHFSYPDDGGSFARAALRCVGVGQCRRLDSGTMCPSFMVTCEEEHSTRGRARLLFEMLDGDVIGGWQDEHVRGALDLCLACKGCMGDCPVHVDTATYKAEFLSRYYERRLRPRSAYAMGLIHRWARLAGVAPRVANFLTQSPTLRVPAGTLAGIAPERHIPAVAPGTFRHRFANRPAENVDGSRVILWPDTFNDHVHPETLQAVVEVLETAGFRVTMPQRVLCCGRPLYDVGMLDLAGHMLRQVLDALRSEIRTGVPVVGLEPSCVSVLRDELTNLLAGDQDAHRLASKTFHFSEFVNRHGDALDLPRLERRALVHGHCHHKAVLGMRDEETILGRLGLDYHVVDSGCCGMAGAFGFERDHYDVSIKAGERVLLPAVRGASPDTIVIADGFSCREQIAQGTDRDALHLAQVVQMAMRDRPTSPAGDIPEHGYDGTADAAPDGSDGRRLAVAGHSVLAGLRRPRRGTGGGRIELEAD